MTTRDNPTRLTALAAILLLSLCSITSAQPSAPVSPLGSADFRPTPEHPVGWRGDWTGRFPGATPPTKWSRTGGATPASSGILWMTPIPAGGSSPIVVGDKVFFGFDPSGLICISKTDGRILWYRTHHYYEVMPEEQRKTIADKAAAPYAKISQSVDAEMKRMSAAVSPAGLPDGQRFMDNAWSQQTTAERKALDAAVLEVDRVRYNAPNKQPWEWASATPASDGKYVYMWYSNRVAVCYDLDGNRQWATVEPGKYVGAEHGCHSSPLLVAGKLIIQYGREMIAFDTKTGQVAWRSPMATGAEKGSVFGAMAAGVPYAVSSNGQSFRASDGEVGWGPAKGFNNNTTTGVADKDRLFFAFDSRGGLLTAQIPATPAPKAQAPGKVLKLGEGFTDGPSPLFDNGLVYLAGEKGLFGAFDPAAPDAGAKLYEKQLPLAPHIEYVFYPGIAASPALAGKYVYVMDNQGGVVVIEAGREYKELAVNKLSTFEKNNRDKQGAQTVVNEQTVTNPFFDGKLMLIRGQQYLYCIGEK